MEASLAREVEAGPEGRAKLIREEGIVTAFLDEEEALSVEEEEEWRGGRAWRFPP